MLMQNMGGQTKSIMVFSEVAYRPFPSSPQSLFQSESKCEFFVMVISSNFKMKKTDFHNKDFALSLDLKWRLK